MQVQQASTRIFFCKKIDQGVITQLIKVSKSQLVRVDFFCEIKLICKRLSGYNNDGGYYEVCNHY
jgi:hypothetical protein